MATARVALLLLFSTTVLLAGTARHVVATGGVTSGNALDSATGWTFAWSGKGNTVIQPGDTVWLHGGVHLGGAEMEMVGTADNPIIYRNWQNQRVQIVAPTVDGIADECIWAKGKHNWFWGLELWNSDSTGGPWESGGGITFVGDSNKAINCILHNLLDVGIRDQSQPKGTEVTGCIFYYNGRQSLHDNQGGYAFYTQQHSSTPPKLYRDNVYWGQWGTGGQVYGTDMVNITNIRWMRNVAFNNGNLRGHESDFSGDEKFMPQLIFGNTEATGEITNDTLVQNYFFCSTTPSTYHYANIGYNGGASSGIKLDSNIFVGDDIALWLDAGTTGFSLSRNTIIGPVNPSDMATTFPNNNYKETRSSGWTDTVIVHQNPYEPKRANVIIYNLDGSSTVSVDPSSILTSGDTYVIVSATNFYGDTLASGTWTSGSITITMADITLDRYIEDDEAGHTTYAPRNPAPYFASLVLLGGDPVDDGLHVTVSGAGDHDGSNVANAWTLAEALANADDDDVVNIHAGTYTDVFNPAHSGSAGYPITFKAYGTDLVTLAGPGSGAPHVTIDDDYITLYGLTICPSDYATSTNDFYWVDIPSTADHLTIRKCRIFHPGDVLTQYHYSGTSTRQNSPMAIAATNLIVDSCYIRGGGNNGMVVATVDGGSNQLWTADTLGETCWISMVIASADSNNTADMDVTIDGCTFLTTYGEDHIQTQPEYRTGSWEESATYSVRGVYVQNCTFYDGREDFFDLKASHGMVIQNNIMYVSDGDNDGAFDGGDHWGGAGIDKGDLSISRYNIIRNNVIVDAHSGIHLMQGSQVYNNLMANNRRSYNGPNQTDADHSGITGWNEGSEQRVILNNIITGQSGSGNGMLRLGVSGGTALRLDGNLYWDSTSTPVFYRNNLGTATYVAYTGLSAWRTELGSNSDLTYIEGKDARSQNADPLFVNFPVYPYNGWDASWDYSLDSGSPAIEAGVPHTYANGSGSSSTSLTVDNAAVFADGNAHVSGDSIAINGANPVLVTNANPSTNVLTLSSARSWSDNDSVFLWSNGVAVRDIGPYSFTSHDGVDPDTTGGTLPDTTTLVSPTDGSTELQPITFRWRAVPGATKYWFSLTTDEWTTLDVNNSALTDTFIVVSGLTPGDEGWWNVATGNDEGWNTDSWASWWTVTIGQTQPVEDTLAVDWNKTIVHGSLAASTAIEFSNLQRRDLLLVLYNPTGYTVEWPASVQWIGMAEAPQPTIGDTTVYWFVRDGTKVYGFDMTAEAANNSVTAAWVRAQLATKADSNRVIPVANVRAYGAVGDGVADDRAAILAAIAASPSGGTVFFPIGEYRVSSAVVVSDSNITLAGVNPARYNAASKTFSGGSLIVGQVTLSGKGDCIKDIAVQSTGDCVVIGGEHATITNVVAAGSDAQAASHCFLTQGTRGTVIKDVKAYHNYHGIAIRSSDVSVSNAYAEDCGLNGLVIKSDGGEANTNITVDGFVFRSVRDTTMFGVQLYLGSGGASLSNITLSNIIVDSAAQAAIYAVNWYDTTGGAAWKLMRGINISNVTASHVTCVFDTYCGSNIRFANATGIKCNSAGFNVWQARDISFVSCSVDTTSSYGFFDAGGSSGIGIYSSSVGTYGGATHNGTFDHLDINGVYPRFQVGVGVYDSTLTVNGSGRFGGNVLVEGVLKLGSYAQFSGFSTNGTIDFQTNTAHRASYYGLNKAEDNWYNVIGRNTSGADAVWDLSYIGSVRTTAGDSAAFVRGSKTQDYVPKYGSSTGVFEMRPDSIHKGGQSFIRQNSDTWYTYPIGAAADPTTVALVANSLRAFPLYIAVPYSADSLHWEVTTGASGNCLLGIYKDTNNDLHPDSLVAYTAVSSTSSTGVKTNGAVAVNFTFAANTLYFVAYNADATPSVRAIGKAAAWTPLGMNPAMGTASVYTCWVVSRTYDGTLPAVFPSAARVASSTYPLLIWRVKP